MTHGSEVYSLLAFPVRNWLTRVTAWRGQTRCPVTDGSLPKTVSGSAWGKQLHFNILCSQLRGSKTDFYSDLGNFKTRINIPENWVKELLLVQSLRNLSCTSLRATKTPLQLKRNTFSNCSYPHMPLKNRSETKVCVYPIAFLFSKLVIEHLIPVIYKSEGFLVFQ